MAVPFVPLLCSQECAQIALNMVLVKAGGDLRSIVVTDIWSYRPQVGGEGPSNSNAWLYALLFTH